MKAKTILQKLVQGNGIALTGSAAQQQKVEHALRAAAARNPLLLKGNQLCTITKNDELWIFLASPRKFRFVPIPSDRSRVTAAAA